MSTVNKNNNITKKKVQELLEKYQEKRKISEVKFKKLIKSMRSNYISRPMRTIFYNFCINRMDEKVIIKSKHVRMDLSDRTAIEILYSAGFKVSFIADFLNKNRSSIKREIDKNSEKIWDVNSTKSPYTDKGQIDIKYYSAERAQRKAEENKLKSRKKCKMDIYPKLRESVVMLLKDKKILYSPDVISGLSKNKKLKYAEVTIGANAIYRAVHNRKYGLTINDLPHKLKYYKKKENVHTLKKEVSERKKEISIEVMPEEIKKKLVDTHYEADSIIGKNAGKNNTLITVVNVASQFLFIERSKDKTGDSTKKVFDNLENKIPDMDKIMKTLLLDNGVEFSNFEEIMKSAKDGTKNRFQIYFAHPYASYERGSNENKNRLVRRYFPKGTPIETLTDEKILEIAIKINNMPRKALGYKTPLEVFEYNLKQKNINTDFLEPYRIKLSKYMIS